MIKYSFIIPVYGKATDQNLQFCLEALFRQTIRDFEIIICGRPITMRNPDTDEVLTEINDIKISNIVLETNKMGALMNGGLKVAHGEFIHVWNLDLIVYPDYLEMLNMYIDKFGWNNLYAGHVIDMRGIDSRKHSEEFYFNSFDKPEGFFCVHKNMMEQFREEFIGFATHWSQELTWRLWRKMKFICMRENLVVHMPHKFRISQEEAFESSEASNKLFTAIKEGSA